jgi:hypothetical protein
METEQRGERPRSRVVSWSTHSVGSDVVRQSASTSHLGLGFGA